jgi:quercetin dioxygenase-like cupin family protein
LTFRNYSKGEVKMESINLMDVTEFHQKNPYAKPLHVDKNGRALLFALHPDQVIREHNAPSSPFYIVILKGQGAFVGGDGDEQTFGPGTLLIFGPGENHSIRALEELVFVGFLHGAPGA